MRISIAPFIKKSRFIHWIYVIVREVFPCSEDNDTHEMIYYSGNESLSKHFYY